MSDILRRAITTYSIRNRRRKARAIEAFVDQIGAESLLLCGALGSGALANEAVVEREVARKFKQVMAFDVVALGPQPWPFVVADARMMPFRDQEYDLAVANAVIEHVGGEADQRRMIDEHVRVARHWVITTPNKWFPVESHTATVLKHWVPRWRERRTEFTRLLSRREFVALLPTGSRIEGRPWSATFTAYSR